MCTPDHHSPPDCDKVPVAEAVSKLDRPVAVGRQFVKNRAGGEGNASEAVKKSPAREDARAPAASDLRTMDPDERFLHSFSVAGCPAGDGGLQAFVHEFSLGVWRRRSSAAQDWSSTRD